MKRYIAWDKRATGVRLIVVWLALTAGSMTLAADVSVSASSTNPAVGQTFTVTVSLDNTSPFGVWGESLKFDPAKLEVTAQASGTFTNFVADSRTPSAIAASGEIRAGGYGFGNGFGGSGTLGVFTFKALAAGTTQIATANKAVGSPFGNVLIPTNGVEILPNLPPQPLVITIGESGDTDGDGMPDTWETTYQFNPNDAGDALLDWDQDGMSNLAEYIAGTDPRDAEDKLQVTGCRLQVGDFYLRFLTETGRVYGVMGRGEMTGTSQWVVVTNGIPGTGGYVEVRDPASEGQVPVMGAKKFYRIMVRLQ